MTKVRSDILKKLEELSNRYPDWRFGQLVANVSYWAKEPTVEAIWDVEDEEFLQGIDSHLEQRKTSSSNSLTSSDPSLVSGIPS